MGAKRPSATRGALKTRGGAERPLPTRGAVAWTRQPPNFFLLLDKLRNLSKFVSVLLSKRFDVSRMRNFFINHATSPKLYWSYDPHRSIDSMSPVCRSVLD